MRMNTNIALGGQQPNFLQSQLGAVQMASAMKDMQRQNRLAEVFQQHGQGIMSGDQNALAALGQVDPMAALDISGRHQTQQIDQERLELARQASRREAQRLTMDMDAATLAREREAARREADVLSNAYARAQAEGDPAIFDSVAQRMGAEGVTFDTFPEYVPMIEGALEGFDAAQERFNQQDEGPTSVQEYQFAKDQGFEGSYQDFLQSKRSQTNVNITNDMGTPMPGLSKLGEGMTYLYNEDGTVRMDEQGRPMAAPVAGTEKDLERQDIDQKTRLAATRYEQKFDLVDDKLDEAITMLSEGGRWVAGAGSVLSRLPETDARSFQATIDTIKANLGFEELQAMRDSSPTGGALGQVTERELAFLQSVQANLDTAQDPEQLLKILEDVKARRAEFAAERARIMGRAPEGAGDIPPPPEGRTAEEWQQIWQHMSPEDRALFQ